MADPTLYQHTSTSSNRNAVNTVVTFYVNLMQDTGAGNCSLITFEYNSALTVSSVISQTVPGGSTVDTATLVRTVTDATNSQKLSVYKIENGAGGARAIRIVLSSGSLYFSAHYSEFSNIATSGSADGDNGTTVAASTTWQSGSITTVADNDLIYQVAIQDDAIGWYGTGFTPDTGFTLLGANLADGSCIQYKIQTTHGAINPTITCSSSQRANSITVALKSASAGTAIPNAIRIVNMSHFSAPITVTTYTVQVPCTAGNFLILLWDGYPDVADQASTITSLTDSGANTWTHRVSTQINNGNSIITDSIWDARAVSGGNSLKLTIVVDHATTIAAGSCLTVLEVVNVLGTAFDVATSNSGEQLSGDGPLEMITIAPSTINGMVIMAGNQDIGTMTGFTTPTGAFFMSPWHADADGDPTFLVEDRPIVAYYNANLDAVTFTITGTQTSGVGVDEWVAVAACYKFGTIPNEPRIGTGFQRTHRPRPFAPGLAR